MVSSRMKTMTGHTPWRELARRDVRWTDDSMDVDGEDDDADELLKESEQDEADGF
jgi:hypothetical protein